MSGKTQYSMFNDNKVVLCPATIVGNRDKLTYQSIFHYGYGTNKYTLENKIPFINDKRVMQKDKFSDLIGELTEMWLLWMKHNNITKDETIPFDVRRKSVDECERLINSEYEITAKLDKFFEK